MPDSNEYESLSEALSDPAFLRRQAIIDSSIEGTRAAIRSYAVTLIDHEDGMAPSSGTIFQIGRRVLVATAAHCIPQTPNGRLWLVSGPMRYSGDGFPGFTVYRKSSHADVGVLEIHPEGVERFFSNRQFCTLKDIATLGVGVANSGVLAVGSPSEHVVVGPTNEPNVKTYVARIMTYWTVSLQPSEWPEMKGIETADVSRDIFLSYPWGVPGQCITDTEHGPVDLPKAPGMSGGGVWDQQMSKGKLWSAASPKIFGIISKWSDKGGYLRAIQISHWLRLVEETFPDLRGLIREAHPNI
jgi:hypothetical protein